MYVIDPEKDEECESVVGKQGARQTYSNGLLGQRVSHIKEVLLPRKAYWTLLACVHRPQSDHRGGLLDKPYKVHYQI